MRTGEIVYITASEGGEMAMLRGRKWKLGTPLSFYGTSSSLDVTVVMSCILWRTTTTV